MPIIKSIIVANGNAPTYHKISSITITETSTEITVNSWISKEAFEQNMPLCWQERYTGPAVASIEEAELLLVAVGGALENGVIVQALTDVELAKARKKMSVEEELSRRIYLPIELAEGVFDGNETAQGNVMKKLAEMKARIDLSIPTPVEMLVWRDAENVTHEWPDLVTYHAWLSGYAVLLSTRGTLMYRQSWIHKSAIDALSTIEEIRDYDIYQGWL